jgi:hypothetical protein
MAKVGNFITQLIFALIIGGAAGLLVYLIWFGQAPGFLQGFIEKEPEPEILPETTEPVEGILENPSGEPEEEPAAEKTSLLPPLPAKIEVPPLLPPATVLPEPKTIKVLDPKAFVALNCDGRAGTGFFISEDGMILTVKHIVQAMSNSGESLGEPAKKCWVWTLDDFNRPPPEYVVFDAEVLELAQAIPDLPFADDFAILKISEIATKKEDCEELYPAAPDIDSLCGQYYNEVPSTFPVLSLNQDLLLEDESVVNVGLPREFANTKSLFRAVGAIQESYKNVVIVAGNTEGGFSGGAVINQYNEVSALIYASDRENLTYAIPMQWIVEHLDNL